MCTLLFLQPMLFPVVAVYSGEADRTLSAAFAPGVPALFRVGGVTKVCGCGL